MHISNENKENINKNKNSSNNSNIIINNSDNNDDDDDNFKNSESSCNSIQIY